MAWDEARQDAVLSSMLTAQPRQVGFWRRVRLHAHDEYLAGAQEPKWKKNLRSTTVSSACA